MAKECSVCGKSINPFAGRVSLSDGYACYKCWKAAGHGTDMNSLNNAPLHTCAELKATIAAKDRDSHAISNFTPTKDIGGIIAFDDNTQTFTITSDVNTKKSTELFRYDQIYSYDLIDNRDILMQGGPGYAEKDDAPRPAPKDGTCSLLQIRITLNGAHRRQAYAVFVNIHVYRKLGQYKAKYQLALDTMAELQKAVKLAHPENE